MSIGTRLIELRNKKGLTRVQMAEELNIPHTTLRNYETDAREPGHKFLLEASRYFGVTTDYILDNEKPPAPEDTEDEEYKAIVHGLTGMFKQFGWLGADGDISDEDRRFILSVAAMLDAYFEEKR